MGKLSDHWLSMNKSLIGLTIAWTLLLGSCRTQMNDNEHIPMTSKTVRDINLVKEDHTNELMSLPGVVGVYVGSREDSTPCIGVMVVKKTPELEAKIPKELEGDPVKIDETGEIKPLN